MAITDSTGAIKNKYAYNDFGQIATNSTETIANSFKYVGKFGVMTDAPDLLFMQARYYMPSVGRFINKDPIGFGGGINMYNYVSSNPINFIDPMGLLNIPGLNDDIENFLTDVFSKHFPTMPSDLAKRAAKAVRVGIGVGELKKLLTPRICDKDKIDLLKKLFERIKADLRNKDLFEEIAPFIDVDYGSIFGQGTRP